MSNYSDAVLIPTAAAAEQLGVTSKTIARWVSEGRLTPAVRAPGLRGAMLFERTAIAAFAAEKTAKASA